MVRDGDDGGGGGGDGATAAGAGRLSMRSRPCPRALGVVSLLLVVIGACALRRRSVDQLAWRRSRCSRVMQNIVRSRCRY